MNNLIKNIVCRQSFWGYPAARTLFTTPATRVKHIEISQEKDVVTVRGKTVESGREQLLVPQIKECARNGERFCPECSLGLDIKHTDVLILSQYVRSDGCMLPRRVTGLCKRQQKKIGTMVTMAHKAGLMGSLKPANCKKDPEKRYGFKKFNKYFFEDTIKLPRAICKQS
ncbi:unnamed protein product [Chironomus riparius]|uniref:Large ribosomal subunit protein mL66 n=1 Tax=Chironomus riparius TaxID=315576 RepID=A0A9N9WTL3_9DIPT|nr:unnamed protein product [Chironomus riparius]